MRLPLVIFTLILLIVHLIRLLVMRPPPSRAGARPAEGAAGLATQLFEDAVPPYLFIGLLALLMIAFGKPTLLAQYGAWGVIVLQGLRGVALWRNAARLARVLGVLIAVALIVLWIYQLPVFDPLPS